MKRHEVEKGGQLGVTPRVGHLDLDLMAKGRNQACLILQETLPLEGWVPEFAIEDWVKGKASVEDAIEVGDIGSPSVSGLRRSTRV